jgi:tetratricopeptide (TPR) repeat protein
MPVTIDHEAAKMYLASATPDDVPTQGTVIADALKMCYAAFNPKDKTFKSVVLISDGEDHDEEAVKVTKQLSKEGIMVNTIGIGSPEGATILDPQTGQLKTDEKGMPVISKLNEKELSDIAKAGNGIYQLYTNTELVAGNIKKQLSNIGQEATISDSSYSSFKQYFQYFLAAAFILLLIEFFTSEKRKKLKNATLTLFFISLSAVSFSQNTNSLIKKGNDAYKQNKWDEAASAYRDALKKSEDNTTANYNLGNVFYKKDNTEEAVKSYNNVIAHTDDNSVKQKAFYNKGVAYQKAKKLPECIVAYKNALILNPNDEDARQNLQRALKQQQQQNQNNQDKNKKNQQQPKDQKNDHQKQTQPPPSRISKQDAEEKLKSLLENEKQLQEKLHKIKGAATSNTPEKDW